MKIEIKILNKEFYGEFDADSQRKSIGRRLPFYATSGSAAMDLVCTEDVAIYSGQVKAIHTGLAIWIGSRPETPTYGCTALILPRSGLGTKGLVLANTIGLIDEDYQGELIVQAWNRNKLIFNENKGFATYYRDQDLVISLKAGDRFAQLMFVPVIKPQWDVVEQFSSITERGQDGFGSTGK